MSYQTGPAGPDQPAELFADPRDREVRPRSRALVTTVLVLLVMGLFVGGLWLAYVLGMRHGNAEVAGEIPLIRADARPTKVKPEKPGGMEIPDRDMLIYTQKRAVVEHLLPPPEKPMPRPTAPAAHTIAVQPPAVPAPAAGAAPAIALPAQPEPPPVKPAVKSAAAPAAPPKAGGVRIQLGSVRSEDAARHEWDRLKRGNPDLLGGLSVTTVRADLGDRGVYYRIQAGPVADADRMCGELRRRNVGCIIAR